MQVEILKKLNATTQIKVVTDGRDLEECLLQVTPFIQMEQRCELCKSENISLQARLAGDNQEYCYIELYCKDCRAKQNFGKYKKGGYFLKNWERYAPASKEV